MRKIKLLVLSVLLLSCSDVKPKHTKNKIASIDSITNLENSIVVDGDLSDWDTNYFVNGLTNPWNDNAKDETLFDFKVIDDQFYFYFKTKDDSPTMIPYIDEMSVVACDRVELFFSPDKAAQNYYCAEMNPRGEVLDSYVKYYREFDRNWDFKSLKLATKISLDGYIVEGLFSLKELQALGFGTDELYMGIFRADYYEGDKVDWYTKTIPDSEEPDFHIPSAFEKISLR